MKNGILQKNFKRLLVLIFIIYLIYTFISQQKTLNSYAKAKEMYTEEKEIAQEEQEKLYEMKKNVDSDEYIEQIAREKLGMYYPNERVYIDVEK